MTGGGRPLPAVRIRRARVPEKFSGEHEPEVDAMKMSEMYPSKFMSKDDVPQPITAVIQSVTREEVKGDNGDELKNVVHFRGEVKSLILNKGNALILSEAYGDDSTAWHGRPVEVYTDPGVMFAGKRVGGIRLRIPTGATQAVTVPPSNGAELWDVSDGTTVRAKQTTDQVRIFLTQVAVPLQNVRVKPAGAGREQAQTADVWIGQHQHADPAAFDNDPIPF